MEQPYFRHLFNWNLILAVELLLNFFNRNFNNGTNIAVKFGSNIYPAVVSGVEEHLLLFVFNFFLP